MEVALASSPLSFFFFLQRRERSDLHQTTPHSRYLYDAAGLFFLLGSEATVINRGGRGGKKRKERGKHRRQPRRSVSLGGE
jgi:hypothetical protein